MMRKIRLRNPVLFFSVFLVFFAGTASFSQTNSKTDPSKVHWYTLNQAIELARIAPRPIFLDIYTPWCGWCKVMDKRTFAKKSIAQFMNTHFYCVKFDAEGRDTVLYNGQQLINAAPVDGRNSTHPLAFSLLDGHLAYPSLVFLDEQGKRIYALQSFMKPSDFEKYMDFIEQGAYKKESYDDFYSGFPEKSPLKEKH